MNYQAAVQGLIAEAKRGVRFQGMGSAKKVLLIIGLIPLIVYTFFSVVSYYVLLFFYKGFTAPLEYLHRIVKDESKDVKHATQFAVYWIAFPFVFFLYVMQSFAAFMFYFQWFGLMVCMYLVTLGGVKFQPFLMDVKYDEETHWVLTPGNTGTTVFTVFLIFFDALIALGILLADSFPGLAAIGALGVMVMLFLVNPLTFKKHALVAAPVVEEEAPAEEVAE